MARFLPIKDPDRERPQGLEESGRSGDTGPREIDPLGVNVLSEAKSALAWHLEARGMKWTGLVLDIVHETARPLNIGEQSEFFDKEKGVSAGILNGLRYSNAGFREDNRLCR